MEKTINELLVLEKILKSRLGQLTEIQGKSARRFLWEDSKKVEEPTYDIKLVDKKIVKINNALLTIEAAIKQSNAMTKASVSIDADELLSPIE